MISTICCTLYEIQDYRLIFDPVKPMYELQNLQNIGHGMMVYVMNDDGSITTWFIQHEEICV